MKHFQVKTCGMTRIQDAVKAADLGADMIGLIFYHKTPRRVTLSQAARIIDAIPSTVDKVGVLVEPELDFALHIADRLKLDYLQWHGRLTGKMINSIKKEGLKIIQACSIGNQNDLALAAKSKADLILLDNRTVNQQGGSGERFDWTLKLPKTLNNIILAGGLNAKNVAEGIRRFTPLLVDVNSGIEQSPGLKSNRKLIEFFKVCDRLRYGS